MGEKFAADKKIFDQKFQKQFDELRKDADKHFSKAMSEESKATAEEQKKQILKKNQIKLLLQARVFLKNYLEKLEWTAFLISMKRVALNRVMIKKVCRCRQLEKFYS